jgi:hypothetical protein
MRHGVKLFFVVMVTAAGAAAALHFDVTGGYSLQSAYKYFDGNPAQDNLPRVVFSPINNVCASSRLSIDVWRDTYRFGVYGGFLRRYELYRQENTGLSVEKEKIGEILSIPLFGFIEGRCGSLFYEFGTGPFITRFNYQREDLPQFGVTSLFGFLFGAGYEHVIGGNFAIQVKGELLVNAPVFVVDFLDDALKEEIENSRYTVYNSRDFQTIIYNAAIACGVRYDFGKNVRIPLDDAITALHRLIDKQNER